MNGRAKQTGFTIVELLIVIVVIAILAAISVVSYNGIAQRAANTQTISAVQGWAKVLVSYATIKGDYPFSGSLSQTPPFSLDRETVTHNYPCLGVYQNDICASITNAVVVGVGHAYVDTTWNNLIQQQLGESLPQPSQKNITINNQIHRGAFISLVGYSLGMSPDGVGPSINFFLSGSECPDNIAGYTVTSSVGTGGVRCYFNLPSFRE